VPPAQQTSLFLAARFFLFKHPAHRLTQRTLRRPRLEAIGPRLAAPGQTPLGMMACTD